MKVESTATRNLRGTVGRWVFVFLLGAVAGYLAVELVGEGPLAAAQVMTGAKARKVVAVAGQITGETYGVYLVDLEGGIITVYQWLAGTKKLRLLAALNYTYDLRLDEYNTEPSPKEIRGLIRQSRRLGETEPP